MTPRGPCFPSPVFGEDSREWRRFEAADRRLTSNPWPQLVDLDHPRIAYSQSLMRLWYYPVLTYFPKRGRPWAKRRPSAGDTLRAVLIAAHELIHLCLDLTPSRELGRLCLADAHQHVHELVMAGGQRWSPELEAKVTRLDQLNTFLDEWGQAVAPAEELMATAVAFHLLNVEMIAAGTPAGFEDFVVKHEMAWISAQATGLETLLGARGISFPRAEFEDLYVGFRRVLLLLTGQHEIPLHTALARLSIFLEPVRHDRERQELQLVESLTRCQSVVEAVAGMTDGAQLLRWLDQAVCRSEDWAAWTEALTLSDRFQAGGPYEHPLWTIAGESVRPTIRPSAADMPSERQRRYWLWSGPPQKWSYALTQPTQAASRWYINTTVSGLYRKGDDYLLLLVLEALRQQLDVGIGFRCPAVDPRGACTCARDRPEIKRGIERLRRWSAEDRFGDGEWSDLPFPCGADRA